MGVRVGIDTGGTFTDLVAVDDATGRWYVAKVPSNPGNPGGRDRRGARDGGVRPGGRQLRRRRHDDRHQRRAHAQGRARPLPHDARASRTSRTSSASTASTTTTSTGASPSPLVHRPDCLGVAERVDEEGGVLEPIDLDGARRPRRRAHRRERRRARRGGGLPALLLPQPRSRARDARPAARALPRPARLALARDRADLARVRARHDDGGRRLHRSRSSSATWTASRPRSTSRASPGAGRCSSRTAGTRSRTRRASARRTCCSRASPAARSAARTWRARPAASRRSRSTWAGRAATSA